jgi:hypothetical protein
MAEPLGYAYDGYDLGYFFLSMLMDYGRKFPSCLHEYDYRLLHTQYRFDKMDGGGYYNAYWNIYFYSGYSLIRIPYLY